MDDDKREGWVCPNCGMVNSPDVEQCPCTKTEQKTPDIRTLLNEGTVKVHHLEAKPLTMPSKPAKL